MRKKHGPVKMSIENGVLVAIYRPGLIIDLEKAKQIVKERIEFTNGKTLPVLVDDRGVKSMTKQAREFFGSGDSIRNISACGLVYRSIFGALLVRFFLVIQKPPIPIRLFVNHGDALQWLEGFKPKNDN